MDRGFRPQYIYVVTRTGAIQGNRSQHGPSPSVEAAGETAHRTPPQLVLHLHHPAAPPPCSQNGSVLSRGGCPNRWHSLVNCDHGDSTSGRWDSPVESTRMPPELPRPLRTLNISCHRADTARGNSAPNNRATRRLLYGQERAGARTRAPPRAPCRRARRPACAPAPAGSCPPGSGACGRGRGRW
eukprot:COSAG01_NODE_16781_length_1204_cov_12.532127_2_plen_185_part_00